MVVRPLPQHEPLGASFPWLLWEGVTPKAPHPGWKQPKGQMLGGPQVHTLKSYPGWDGSGSRASGSEEVMRLGCPSGIGARGESQDSLFPHSCSLPTRQLVSPLQSPHMRIP